MEKNEKYTAFTEAEKHCIEIDCPYFVEWDIGYGTCFHSCRLQGQSEAIDENSEPECYQQN